MKRFAEIIIGAGLEAIDFLMPGVTGRKYDDRNVIMLFTPGPQDLHAGQARQAQVQYNHIVGFGTAEKFTIRAIIGDIYGETGTAQRIPEFGLEFLIVFDQQ